MTPRARSYPFNARRGGQGAPASTAVRRWAVLLAGCAAMAVSGGGLAGWLDLSTATAADAPPPADAPYLTGG